MLTLILSYIHANRNNDDFDPYMLYVGVFVLDVVIVERIIDIFLPLA